MRRILVAGELNADLVMTGLPSLPVLGQELTGTGFQIVMGSSSAITAARLAALGAPVEFVGQVGDDDLGQFIVRELRGFGVKTGHIAFVPNANTDITIALTYEHDRALLTYPRLMTAFDGAAITPDLLAGCSHLHVGSFFLQTRLQPELPRLFDLARSMGLTTSLDTGWDPQERWMENPHLEPTLAATDYFFPNAVEAAALCAGTFDPLRLVQHVRTALIVKRGAEGALAVSAKPGSAIITMPAIQVDVVDTTGAGDAFNAGFLYATVIMQNDLYGALRFAVACGAQAVTQVGGATNAPSADVISTHYLDLFRL